MFNGIWPEDSGRVRMRIRRGNRWDIVFTLGIVEFDEIQIWGFGNLAFYEFFGVGVLGLVLELMFLNK